MWSFAFTSSSIHVLQGKVLCVYSAFQQRYGNFGRNLANYKYFKENFCIPAVLFSQDSFWWNLEPLNLVNCQGLLYAWHEPISSLFLHWIKTPIDVLAKSEGAGSMKEASFWSPWTWDFLNRQWGFVWCKWLCLGCHVLGRGKRRACPTWGERGRKGGRGRAVRGVSTKMQNKAEGYFEEYHSRSNVW